LRQDAAHRGNADAKLMLGFEPLAEFTQGGVWSHLHQGLHHIETAGIHFGRITPTMGLRSDTARFSVVFEQPAYKAQTDTKGGGQLPHRAFAVFIGLDNPYP
jgi:hypothetical protein